MEREGEGRGGEGIGGEGGVKHEKLFYQLSCYVKLSTVKRSQKRFRALTIRQSEDKTINQP